VDASIVNLTHPGHYLHWGFVQLSLANAIVIVTMLVVFGLALILPFRSRRGSRR
jgi:hypothetical protein